MEAWKGVLDVMLDESEISFDSKHIAAELADVVSGRRLGGGAYRLVFACAIDKSLVFKVQKDKYRFDNVCEWEAWWQYRHMPSIAKWLAPCIAISPCGTVLLQARTTPLQNAPEKLPAFLCDTKMANYGTIGKGKNKRVVCHDYGFLLPGPLKTGMKKVKWWNTESIYFKNQEIPAK